MAATTEQLNAALSGRYTILRHIGEGGMAVVYLARDLKHDRQVALKVLKPDLNAVLGNDRFLSEIRVTANLQHPNLLPLFDSGIVDQLLFYVMPYVEGESLRDRLDRERQLPVPEAVRMTEALGKALDYAHRSGVIHRDLKPENILLQDGQPLIADFGIALAASNAGGGRITQTGLSLGTPQYMSPEQATGDRAIDARTDQYSLGAVAYEMLTGEPPHVGATSQAVMARLLTESPRPLRAVRPSVPAHVDAAVMRALEKLPADRWESTREFVEALHDPGMTRGLLRSGERATASDAAMAGVRRRERLAWGVAALASAAAVGGAWMAAGTEAPVPARSTPIVFTLGIPDSVGHSQFQGGTVEIDRAGTTIAYIGKVGLAPQALYVHRLDGTTSTRVSGTEEAILPMFSPDGTSLRFVVIPRGSDTASTLVQTVPLAGGAPAPFVRVPGSAGRWSERPGSPVFVAWGQGLGVTQNASSSVTQWPLPDARVLRARWPDVLPGGRHALVSTWVGSTENDSAYVGLVDVTDGALQVLPVRGLRPRYSPTGHLLWSNIAEEIWAARWSPARPLDLGTPFRVAEGAHSSLFSVSDNGVLVYRQGFGQSSRGLRTIVSVSRNGSAAPRPVATGYVQHPRISPDGSQVLYSKGTAGNASLATPDIWRDDARGVSSRVTVDGASLRPSWFPDGQRLAHIVRYADDSSFAVVRRADGTGDVRLVRVHDEPVRGVTVSPSGDYLALSVGGADASGGADIWVVHVDSLDAPRRWLSAPYHEWGPRFSPDGRWLTYVSMRDGQEAVYIRAFAGGPELRVSSGLGREPLWSRRGDEIFFRDGSHMVAARVAFSNGNWRVLGETKLFDALRYFASAYGPYDVSADGQKFYMIRDEAFDRAAVAVYPIRVIIDWPLLEPRTP